MPLIRVPHAQLVRHPRNMRLTYHLADVRRMGLSQVARVRRGLEPCIQPLIITLGPGKAFNPKRHDPLTTHFTIVAGHLRHAGNAWLKKDAPPLNCLIRNYPDEDSMLAEMRTENGMRADISPLGWARHFQASLAEDPSLTVNRLARESGKSVRFVTSRLSLLSLQPAAQKLVDSGALPFGAVEHLLNIEDPQTQVKAARSFANSGAKVNTIRKRVEALLAAERPKPKPRAALRKLPAVDGLPDSLPTASLSALRTQAASACSHCDIGQTLPLAEPAWHIALKAAGETCDCCGLQTLKGACSGCPLAEVMASVVRQARANAAAPQRAGLRP